jgi:hypothetical protein
VFRAKAHDCDARLLHALALPYLIGAHSLVLEITELVSLIGWKRLEVGVKRALSRPRLQPASP